MYNLQIKEGLDKKFKKIKKKDMAMMELINRKVSDVLDDPYRFKPLRKPLKTCEEYMLEGLLCLFMKSMKKKW